MVTLTLYFPQECQAAIQSNGSHPCHFQLDTFLSTRSLHHILLCTFCITTILYLSHQLLGWLVCYLVAGTEAWWTLVSQFVNWIIVIIIKMVIKITALSLVLENANHFCCQKSDQDLPYYSKCFLNYTASLLTLKHMGNFSFQNVWFYFLVVLMISVIFMYGSSWCCEYWWPGPVFCLLLGVSSDYAQPITGQVTEVTCPVIGGAQPELTPSKRQKTGPGALTRALVAT